MPNLESGRVLTVMPDDSEAFPTKAMVIGAASGAVLGFVVGLGLDNIINDGHLQFGAGSVWGPVIGALLGAFVGIELAKVEGSDL